MDNGYNIISGGSSGADSGALLAGERLNISIHGFIMESTPDFIKKKYLKLDRYITR